MPPGSRLRPLRSVISAMMSLSRPNHVDEIGDVSSVGDSAGMERENAGSGMRARARATRNKTKLSARPAAIATESHSLSLERWRRWRPIGKSDHCWGASVQSTWVQVRGEVQQQGNDGSGRAEQKRKGSSKDISLQLPSKPQALAYGSSGGYGTGKAERGMLSQQQKRCFASRRDLAHGRSGESDDDTGYNDRISRAANHTGITGYSIAWYMCMRH